MPATPSIMPYALVRPLLFKLDPENAHHLTLNTLRTLNNWGLDGFIHKRVSECPVEVMGLKFPNPVGLAAGLDKNGDCIDALAAMGFGFIEIGTVTPRPQGGNPRPRMFRLPAAEALINRMGFNNEGVDTLVANVRRARYRGILGINIGKNATTPNDKAIDDYLYCLNRVYEHASYIAVNISSPNTKNLRDLQSGDALNSLLSALRMRQLELADQHDRYVPVAIKIAPDLEPGMIGEIADLLAHHRMDAVIATNTTISRNGVLHLPGAVELGGLSGAPLVSRSTEVITELSAALAGRLPVIGVGGITRGTDAWNKLEAGATLVQVYSGLVFRGPGLIGDVADACQYYYEQNPDKRVFKRVVPVTAEAPETAGDPATAEGAPATTAPGELAISLDEPDQPQGVAPEQATDSAADATPAALRSDTSPRQP